MKHILCVCDHGNKRSVFTRFLLAYTNDVLSVGATNNGSETLKMLCEWADVILLADPTIMQKLPHGFSHKIDDRFTIGPDIYPVSISGKLLKIIKAKLTALGYL